MAHRLFNALRIVRVRPLVSCTTGRGTTETWHSALPGTALLLAGASTVTVCLCESESRTTSPATSVRAKRPVYNTHTLKWRVYTDKAVQLAREEKLEDAEKYMSLAFSEAIQGFGTESPHTAEARQNLADHYGVMHKYDLAVPLYIEVVDSLTSIYGPQHARIATALHNLAGLYMAQKDVIAASKTMLRAIEARPLPYSDTGHLQYEPYDLWRALAKSVKGLAAIHREAGHSVKEVAKLLEKDLRILTKEGEGYTPGFMVMRHIKPAKYLSNAKPSVEEQQEHITALRDAEAICRALISNLKDRKDHKAGMGLYELSDLCEKLAHIVRAQGRLAEARLLCLEANNHYLAITGKQVAKFDHELPALDLLIEIELEDGSRDSLQRALDYQQGICERGQAQLDQIMDEEYKPTKHIEKYDWTVASKILRLTVAKQRVAEFQSRLDENLDAWASLTQALAFLHSPVLTRAFELEEAERSSTSSWDRERAEERKQEIQRQMSALYEAICSPHADGNAEKCLNLQQELTVALAA